MFDFPRNHAMDLRVDLEATQVVRLLVSLYSFGRLARVIRDTWKLLCWSLLVPAPVRRGSGAGAGLPGHP